MWLPGDGMTNSVVKTIIAGSFKLIFLVWIFTALGSLQLGWCGVEAGLKVKIAPNARGRGSM